MAKPFLRKSLLLVAAVLAASSARAQDIVGLEDCAQARGPDKKIGCLQSNVEFLHQLIKKNESAAQTRMREDAAKLAAVGARTDEMRAEITRLKAALEQVEQKIPKK